MSDAGNVNPEPTIGELIYCAKRELGLRQRVYPNWITRGKIKPEAAQTELDRMAAIVKKLELFRDNETWKPAETIPRSGVILGKNARGEVRVIERDDQSYIWCVRGFVHAFHPVAWMEIPR